MPVFSPCLPALPQVRNQVLCNWRQDVSRRLTEAEAIAAVRREDRPYALAAYRFLSASGYINFGVSTAQQRHLAGAPQGRGSVVVVGAGCAGLAAARQLRAAGYRVVVVEGRDRPGGRVWTERLEVCDGRSAWHVPARSSLHGSTWRSLLPLRSNCRQ
jgi:lysine-specific histone demethylase 1